MMKIMGVANKNKRQIAVGVIYTGIAIWLGWFLFVGPKQSDSLRSPGGENKQEQTAEQAVLGVTDPPPAFGVVSEVVDALTILIDDRYKIRYLGVTVPATSDKVECFGKEAVQANESMLGKTVKLERDEVLTQARDGAWIRYVWVADDENTEAAYLRALNGETVLGLTESLSIDTSAMSPTGQDTPDNSPVASQESSLEQIGDELTGETTNESGAMGNNDSAIGGFTDNGDGAQGLNGVVPQDVDSAGSEAMPAADDTDKVLYKEYMVSERIIEMGIGFPLLSREMKYYDRLVAAARYSSATKRGLWGKCQISQDDNGFLTSQIEEECVIKGFALMSGEKIYRTPSCAAYKDTVILGYKGGKWLCREEEAVNSGFVKAADCK